MKQHLLLLFCLSFLSAHFATAMMLVSEYGTGNIRAFDPNTGNPIVLPSHYAPVGGNSSGADGMVLDSDGRLFVSRGDGRIFRRSADGNSFSVFANLGVEYLLDLDRNNTHLFVAQFGASVIHQVALANAAHTTIAGHPGVARFDGVRIGPDGRLYAVDSSNGGIYAYNLATSTWSIFLTPDFLGAASQLEFGADGRVFLSRTISGQARIYSYTLNTPSNYASGLNASSKTLIGAYGSFGAATGIRIGPDGRLYANAFNAGEVWRSNVGITAMESSAFITGLTEPGSILFTTGAQPPPPPPSRPFWFRAIALNDSVMLRWADPLTAGMQSRWVQVRFDTNQYPADLNAGTHVYTGQDQQYHHTNNIVSGVTHYYTIWVSDDGHNFEVP